MILAIDSDADRTAWLASAVRRRVKAEWVRARTVEDAIKTMETNIPDLLLVPALLSPRDESALMEGVRANAAAAHVQMLTVPVPTRTESASTSRGFLSRFRREQTANESPAGNQAASFADQISASLKHALEARAATDAVDAPEVPEPVSRLEPAAEPAPASTEVESDAEVFATFAEFTVAPEPPPVRQSPEQAVDETVEVAPSMSRRTSPRLTWTTAKAGRRAPETPGVRDEWSDLDPLQCGFPALLARLRNATTPRNSE